MKACLEMLAPFMNDTTGEIAVAVASVCFNWGPVVLNEPEIWSIISIGTLHLSLFFYRTAYRYYKGFSGQKMGLDKLRVCVT